MSKKEKKDLCRLLDCQKLSPEVRSHAVRNEHLPLRTVVHVLYFNMERGNQNATHMPKEQLKSKQQDSVMKDDHTRRYSDPGTSEVIDKLRKSEGIHSANTRTRSLKIREASGPEK